MRVSLQERATRCQEDFQAMSASMDRAATQLIGRFVVYIALASGHNSPLLGSNALHDKFAEYLQRAKKRQLDESKRAGFQYPTHAAFLASLSQPARRDMENRLTVRAWSAAKGPFLEALCLLADLLARRSDDKSVPIALFARIGPIRVIENGQERFVWCRPDMVGTRSGMKACPDIVITTDRRVARDTVTAIRECKCHRDIPSDEIRKECGKATDLQVPSYVLVTYYPMRPTRRRGAEGLGLGVEELSLHTSDREGYVKGERDLVDDLADKLVKADGAKLFRKQLEDGAVLAREKDERGRTERG